MILKRCLIMLIMLAGAGPAAATEGRLLLQLVDYVGVDYAGAVQAGEAINPSEYQEMLDFSHRIEDEVRALKAPPGVQPVLDQLAAELSEGVRDYADPAFVADVSQRLGQQLMTHLQLDLLPRKVPSLQQGAAIYQQQCAGCHGVQGQGDGVLAAGISPAPTDFHDPERARVRSLYALYNTITLGVAGTAMQGFVDLPDEDRWALAFYVGGFYASPQPLDWAAQSISLHQAVTETPAELAAHLDNGEALALHARHQPEDLFASRQSPWAVAKQELRSSVQSYQQGDFLAARRHAITAYLEGFELTEASLGNVAPDAVRTIEGEMMAYRALLDNKPDSAEVQSHAENIIAQLEQAQLRAESNSLSPGVAFLSAFIILLREGLEAILVLAAMAAFLIKTGQREGLRWLYGGALLATVAGVSTWAVSTWMFAISGATREVTEGVTALVAAAILFYVGFWMHSRANARKWSEYIASQMNTALSRGALWSFALVSFLAVYREIFETILFYQALWVQTNAGAQHSVVTGGLMALAVLAGITLMIQRVGLRIPLTKFFMVSAWMMIALAFVFVGKGVAALQEAGRLPLDHVAIPRIEWLGIYPSMEGLGLQLLVLVVAVWMFWRQRQAAG
ncbi:cytochrome c/FTR1 family iron permease [Alcanivorax sp. 1008]|uniref:cytochrome c/FTR1 family iron permease n=1 Tax=Alcanivorax sp. 1008 TaxID=2816853 RepID=UPI001D56A064|nr:cytochrome c/FTR1 family iron permease [Alcanivorax sp. 1008]MCC1496143.1 cytochrome c/FTR1 family iron permease [Alcanivorax sp. 1008]